MSYLLRQLTFSKWVNLKIPPDDKDFPADPITDLKTTFNNLSLYLVIDKKRDVDIVVTGLASNKNEIKKLPYVLIKVEDVRREGFDIKEHVKGKTPYDEANLLHRELVDLTIDGLLRLAKLIHKSYQNTFAEPKIRTLLEDTYKKNELNVKQMPHPLHKELNIQCTCKIC